VQPCEYACMCHVSTPFTKTLDQRRRSDTGDSLTQPMCVPLCIRVYLSLCLGFGQHGSISHGSAGLPAGHIMVQYHTDLPATVLGMLWFSITWIRRPPCWAYYGSVSHGSASYRAGHIMVQYHTDLPATVLGILWFSITRIRRPPLNRG
jgi:hypothetical protein